MDILRNVYLNFFSIGALIPTIFSFSLAVFFFLIPRRSKAAFQFSMLFLTLGIFYLGYFVAAVIYHPMASFHRWLTAGFILPGVIHSGLIYFYFPDEKYPRFAKALAIVLYAVAAAVIGYFAFRTLSAGTIFRIDGHFFDFRVEEESRFVALMISIYVPIAIGAGIWRFIVTKSPQRWAVLGILLGFMISSVPTTILNTLSRSGAIEREVYQIGLDLFVILGFSIMAIIFINNTVDKTTFMAKITGISFVTILVILQGLSYFTSADTENAYDLIHRERVSTASSAEKYSGNIAYKHQYFPQKNDIVYAQGDGPGSGMDFRDYRGEYLNALMIEKISELPPRDFQKKLLSLLGGGHAHFAGYREAILRFAASLEPGEQRPAEKVVEHLRSIERPIKVASYKISGMPDENIKTEIQNFFDSESGKPLGVFFKAVAKMTGSSLLKGRDHKDEVLEYLIPAKRQGTRLYRAAHDGTRHYVSFLRVPPGAGSVYEIGFHYREYRDYLHPIYLKYLIVLGMVLLMIFLIFPFFFRGALVNPLNRLLHGFTEVENGNLGVSVDVKVLDEIGSMTAGFNKMVETIRGEQKRLDDTARELEKIAEEKTARLFVAIEEIERARADMDNILKNVKEGIFILDHDLIIGGQYSAILETVLETGSLGGAGFIGILETLLDENELKTAGDFLDVLLNKKIAEKRLLKLNPLNEVKATFIREGRIIEKFLRFSFTRVVEQNEITTILATVEDITEEKELANRIVVAEQKARDEMKLLFGMMHVNPLVLKKFLTDTQNEVQAMEKALESAQFSANLKDILNGAFRAAHSIKGDADQLGLDFFASTAHRFEEKIKVLFNKKDLQPIDLVGLLYSIVDIKNELSSVRSLIEKISAIQDTFGQKEITDLDLLTNTIKELVARVADREGKKAMVELTDFELPRMDGGIMRSLKKIVIQIAKNSVSHGIETPEERAAAGKPEFGTIRLQSYIKDKVIYFMIRDDGRGIQIDSIRKKAVAAGIGQEEELRTWSNEKIAQLIFEPGMSTQHDVTIDSGRGIGLDVVKHEIQAMGGKMHLRYSPGNYTEFEIIIPVN